MVYYGKLHTGPLIFVAMTTVEIKKKWHEWDEATIDSYRLQFRVIDINEDGLIDFHELYLMNKVELPCGLLIKLISIGAKHWMKSETHLLWMKESNTSKKSM